MQSVTIKNPPKDIHSYNLNPRQFPTTYYNGQTAFIAIKNKF